MTRSDYNATPGYNARLTIRFTTDRHGRPLAHYWSTRTARWFRLGYDAARTFVAQGQADEAQP